MSQYGYTPLSESNPLARKKHKCSWCGEAICPGERYERNVGNYCGELQTSKFHPECAEVCHEEARDWGYDYEFSPYSNDRPPKEPA